MLSGQTAATRRAAGAAVLALLLSGCTHQASPSQNAAQDPQQNTPRTAPPQGVDPGSHQRRTLEILAAAYEQIESDAKPELEDQKGPGAEIICTLGQDPLLAWSEKVRLRVDDQEAQAERVRAFLDDQGYARLDRPSTATATGHQLDGFIILVSTWDDGRVGLSVESPCMDEEGNILGG